MSKAVIKVFAVVAFIDGFTLLDTNDKKYELHDDITSTFTHFYPEHPELSLLGLHPPPPRLCRVWREWRLKIGCVINGFHYCILTPMTYPFSGILSDTLGRRNPRLLS